MTRPQPLSIPIAKVRIDTPSTPTQPTDLPRSAGGCPFGARDNQDTPFTGDREAVCTEEEMLR